MVVGTEFLCDFSCGRCSSLHSFLPSVFLCVVVLRCCCRFPSRCQLTEDEVSCCRCPFDPTIDIDWNCLFHAPVRWEVCGQIIRHAEFTRCLTTEICDIEASLEVDSWTRLWTSPSLRQNDLWLIFRCFEWLLRFLAQTMRVDTTRPS